MKRFFQILAALPVLLAVGCSGLNKSMAHPAKTSRLPQTLESKLKVLAGCGLKLAEPFKAEDLLRAHSRQELESPGWDALVAALGDPDDRKPERALCANLWRGDTECIESDGDYAVVVKRLAELTQGSLVLTNVQDRIDFDKNVAWVSFNLNGKTVKIDCKLDDHWLDVDVLSDFALLLDKADPTKTYIVYDTGGQDFLIGCIKKAELKKLNELGIAFVALK